MEQDKMTCPHCGNPDCYVEDEFCFNCGKHLHNFCSNPDCRMSEQDSGGLGPEMVFCPDCGAASTFSKEGYISPKEFS